VTFFTLDLDFFKARLCHPAYALVWLNVRADDAAHNSYLILSPPCLCVTVVKSPAFFPYSGYSVV